MLQMAHNCLFNSTDHEHTPYCDCTATGTPGAEHAACVCVRAVQCMIFWAGGMPCACCSFSTGCVSWEPQA